MTEEINKNNKVFVNIAVTPETRDNLKNYMHFKRLNSLNATIDFLLKSKKKYINNEEV